MHAFSFDCADAGGEPLALGSVADHHEVNVGERAHCLHRQVDALLRDERAHVQRDEGVRHRRRVTLRVAARALGLAWHEPTVVDGVGDHGDLRRRDAEVLRQHRGRTRPQRNDLRSA